MPDVKLYVRSGDWDKWQAIPDKPAWLHEHLNTPLSTNNLGATLKRTKEVLADPRTKSNWCKEHGMDKGYCKFMKHKGAA